MEFRNNKQKVCKHDGDNEEEEIEDEVQKVVPKQATQKKLCARQKTGFVRKKTGKLEAPPSSDSDDVSAAMTNTKDSNTNSSSDSDDDSVSFCLGNMQCPLYYTGRGGGKEQGHNE